MTKDVFLLKCYDFYGKTDRFLWWLKKHKRTKYTAQKSLDEEDKKRFWELRKNFEESADKICPEKMVTLKEWKRPVLRGDYEKEVKSILLFIREQRRQYVKMSIEKNKEDNKEENFLRQLRREARVKRKREIAKRQSDYYRTQKYGISPEEHDKMLKEQNYSCYICGRKNDELKRGLCVDHNHKTGKVRRLLCNHCNTMVGFIEINSVKLNKILDYVKTDGG